MSALLHGLLHDATDRFPGRVAIVDRDREFTYQELDAMANRVARQLIDLDVRRGDRVGLHLEKSADALACLYGVLKIGAAYIPLAPDAPTKRLAHIVRHAKIRVLLTGVELTRNWPELAAPDSPITHIVCVNEPARKVDAPANVAIVGPADLARQADTRPGATVGTDDVAYILYTSGSTGVPKGVMLTHRNALSFVDWAVEEFKLTQLDRLSNHAPMHFDLSIFDFFAAARAAAAVVLVPREVSVFPAELASFVRAKSISVWYSVPSAVNMLAARGGLDSRGLPGLRLVLFAGEVFPMGQLRQALEAFPNADFYNLYGPTETNVCTFYHVTKPIPEDWVSIPIGLPIHGVELLCLTNDGRMAKPNERGELWVHGPTVMPGYLDDPEQTATVLRAPDPTRSDLIAYRTGDLVCCDETGCWHFFGRRDSQIKSRGYRIELGEIEAALNAHDSVAECAVVAMPHPDFGNSIMAYVVTTSNDINPMDLTTYSRKLLPSYMVPWSFKVLSALPRTSTGKIDYQALRVLDGGSDHG